jgi:predicted TIM-barrel fold metal-dependent hydrolase
MLNHDVSVVRPVDIHAHFFPQAYLDVLAEDGPRFGVEYRAGEEGFYIKTEARFQGPLPYRVVDLKKRIADMDAQGTAVQAMSLTGPMAHWGDEEVSHKLARAWNDAASSAHVQYPTRLVGLLTLPMLFADRAIDELNRASTLPGIRGVYMGTNINQRDLDDPLFESIFARIEALDLPYFPASAAGGWRTAHRAVLSLEPARLPLRHCHCRLPPDFRWRARPAPEASVQPAPWRRRVADSDGTHRPRFDGTAGDRKTAPADAS